MHFLGKRSRARVAGAGVASTVIQTCRIIDKLKSRIAPRPHVPVSVPVRVSAPGRPIASSV